MMTVDRTDELFSLCDTHEIKWVGFCHDCGIPVEVVARRGRIDGGAVYEPGIYRFYLKCNNCYKKEPNLVDCKGKSYSCDGYFTPKG